MGAAKSYRSHRRGSLVVLLLTGLVLVAPASGRSSARDLQMRAGATRKGTLRIVVLGLTADTPAGHVVITGPHRFHLIATRPVTIRVAAGTYRVAASGVHTGSSTITPDVARRSTVVAAGHRSTVTIRYRLLPTPPTAPPPSQATGTPPTITSITGTTGSVGNYFVWITVGYIDPECDVIGGTWSAQGGEGTFDFGAWGRADLMRNASCSGGVGSLEFARSCIAVSRTLDRVQLVDARGNRGAGVGFAFSCAWP